jgi:CelD/BcsL family acetyltransferase involved in cellulose biosynthesis
MFRMSLDPVVDPRWNALVRARKSSVFQSPAWLGVLRDTYDLDIRADVLLDEAGDPIAGIAYAKLHDMMDPRIISLPFSDFCDPIVETAEEWEALIHPLLAEGRRLSLRCLNAELPREDARFEEKNRARWHAVALEREPDDIWASLHPSARRSIRKARASGVTVRPADTRDDLRAFFELHLKLRKYKYRLLAQPYRFFENIWDAFIAPGNGALLLAAIGDEVIGGVLFLEWCDTLYYKFNASSAAHLVLRPNDVVVWEGIDHGRRRGLRYVDFGLSDPEQDGLVRYKRKFATDEKEIYLLEHSPDGSPSESDARMRSLLPVLTGLFVDETVPDEITERAGDVLYPFFS